MKAALVRDRLPQLRSANQGCSFTCARKLLPQPCLQGSFGALHAAGVGRRTHAGLDQHTCARTLAMHRHRVALCLQTYTCDCIHGLGGAANWPH